jgi:drug/metabolite transporter (DMT)-like permease
MFLALLPPWLWAAFTVIAAGAQTARNAMQRDLVGSVGTQGATYVRFLFGLPFALLFLGAQRLLIDAPLPVPDLRSVGWAAIGALMQVLATAFMLIAMRDRSFVVTIAFTKTEPIIIALLSIAILGEVPSLMTIAAIVVATAGVLLMSLPAKAQGAERPGVKAALIGLASGACFGFSATGYRVSMVGLESTSFILTATVTMVMGLVIQCAAILCWLALRDRPLLVTIAKNWRPSLFAGFMGALATQFWFLAFAISNPTRVRTLALVEVPFAQIVSRKIFKQRMSAAEIGGMGLIVAGVVLLLNG